MRRHKFDSQLWPWQSRFELFEVLSSTASRYAPKPMFTISCERDTDLLLEVGVRSVELTRVLAVCLNAVQIGDLLAL